uniref:DUF8040 domain-containing protein n=1 Tax=Salix viminalis TaxID=40686 RepID=A0A6N2KD65_SALVM
MECEDMNDPWYNNIVNEDFDGDYENVINCVEEQTNYHASGGASTSMGGGDDGGNDGGNNENKDDDIVTTTTTILMDANTLMSLCVDLETQYGLKPSKRMSVMEKVAMFLFTIAIGASNREVQERFQHSAVTVSRCINEVLEAVCLFAVDVIKPSDPQFTNTPREIAMNQRYMPHFKNCVGAIDGTHVRVCISAENQVPFIGRKGVPTQNVMAACSFDMQFTFVWAGWEGSAIDGTHLRAGIFT